MPHGHYIGPKLLIIVTKEQDEQIRAIAKERHQKINAVVRELLGRGLRSLNQVELEEMIGKRHEE